MRTTVVGLVTPHLMRVVDLANEAEKGINVTWHVRDAVARTMSELAHQFNASSLTDAYLQGLEAAAAQAAPSRAAYLGALQAATAAARILRRD
ncbi:MAG TPA: hypothetical protein VFG18_02950 [Xanthomonadaceae bacterium]|jgi:hypothetical protein|nr:hypothetical protein [Xanthomonadaceae bacterium]